jgi:hypothetical protein
MKSRKQTIVTVVILGMPYNFSIYMYIVLARIIFTEAAAGDGFIPSSLPNSRRKFAIPAK